MAFSDNIITATSELSVTDGVGGPVFAGIIPSGNKAYILGKLGVGTLNPINALDVEGGAAVGSGYSGSLAAPSNGLIVEGDVGIGTASPLTKLDVAGALRVSQDAYLAVSSGNVGIGTAAPLAKLQVMGGALMPSAGNSTAAGILFPQNPGGGAGDGAWMRYYVRAGEGMTLEIGVANEADDHIALMASGNVGIGTTSPVNRLDVSGDVALLGKHALRGSDAWLRLNQNGAFASGVHTPGVFAPGSLNVGGAGGWGNPGNGNIWVTGTMGVGTTTPQRTLHVHNDAWTLGAEIHASGATAGFSFTDREAGRQWDSGGAGQRWVMFSASRTARLWTSGVGDRLTVESNGTLTVIGPYLIVNGGGGERAYIGGDGWGNDVQIGSFNAGVTNVGFWNAPTGKHMKLFAQGYNTVSDARLKTAVEPLSGALDRVLKLRGVSFEWGAGYAEDKSAAATSLEAKAAADKAAASKTVASKAVAGEIGKQVGLIAQEVLEVVPEAVTQDSRGMYAVDYGPLVSVLIEAVKEQNARLEYLEKQLADRK